MAIPADQDGGTTTEAGPAPAKSQGAAPDGTALHLRQWPASGKPWATVLILHGLAEHGGRYERTGRLMAEAGLDVHVFDLRGHGLSGGRRVYVRRWNDYLDDVQSRLAALRRPGLPLVLFGHSMGATMALNYACSDRPKPDLLVLSATTLQATIPAWQRALVPILGRVVPTLVLANPISGDQLASDPAVGLAYFADPLVQPRTTARLGAELMAAMKRAGAELARLHTPTLVIHGGADTLVPTATSELLAELPGVERRVLPNLRHETFNEPQGPEVVAGVVEWLRAHV